MSVSRLVPVFAWVVLFVAAVPALALAQEEPVTEDEQEANDLDEELDEDIDEEDRAVNGNDEEVAPPHGAVIDDRDGLQPLYELGDRWQRFAGGYFNRAPIRSFAGVMARWSAQVDAPAFGQISFEGWAEFSPFDINDSPFSLLAHWGISIGYADAPASSAAFETVQPLYLGAKFNLLREEDYFLTLGTIVGFIDDTVRGEYNPMNLLPGLVDFYWQLSGMFSYAIPDMDMALNTQMVLHFNFGFFTNKVSFSWMIETVFLLSDEIALRGGFDFHTVGSGANIFLQGDFWTDDHFMFFAQFKGFLSGAGRTFDIALMVGATYHFN